MSGTISTPIFKQDGQYLTFIVETAAVTLGQVVKLVSTSTDLAIPSTVTYAGAGDSYVVGVAVSANRASRTATDDQVAVGDRVTVCTRGVVLCTVAAAGSTVGVVQIAGAAGTVTNATDSGSLVHTTVVGKALMTGSSGDVIPVLLTVI